MRKKSFILGIIGVIAILIGISMLLVDKYADKTNNSEPTKNQDVVIDDNNEFNPKSYKKIYINQDSNLYYVVPENVYLSMISTNVIEYKSDDIVIFRYSDIKSNDEIMSKINSNNSAEITKTELDNGNILILEKVKASGYSAERLHLFIKAFGEYSYYVCYQVENISFSDKFINKITSINKYNGIKNMINSNGKWHFDLDLKNKKKFELNYDSSKYSTTDYYKDYTYILKTSDTSTEQITFFFLYDEMGIDESINTTFTINSTEKIKLKNYDTWYYKTSNSENEEYDEYLIVIDNYTKLRIRYPKSIEDKVDVNDFLDFVYE